MPKLIELAWICFVIALALLLSLFLQGCVWDTGIKLRCDGNCEVEMKRIIKIEESTTGKGAAPRPNAATPTEGGSP